ncbi:cell growth-regulating nucleolar protein [Copidosoma floridanum]|uniref:cell growth-regulating nucleolar protein n=1 Tax=Copidosoma floridanum TaxID=29053 RepID=UPI0006C96661|nr:cell growth-regulating nucleolar protein [Copidosoma floridanum]
MVCFTCNHCGDSLQKPKVAKHYQFACRSAPFLTCVDCHKDFRGDEYVAHTKCISESERYGGNTYVAKPNANKGEKKQQAWIDIVQNTLANSKNLTAPERNLLNSISKHENIPRKKQKFYNFIKNLSNNKANTAVVESVWEKMEKAFKDASSNNSNSKSTKLNFFFLVLFEDCYHKYIIILENGNMEEKQKNGVPNASEENETKENGEKESKKKKKSKKRQAEADENDNDQPANKKKAENINGNQEEENNESTANGVDLFSWKSKILEIVSAKGEISLKKLRKRVLAQYFANFPDENAEKATSKFDKKLKKVSGIAIEDEKVKLSS